MKNLLFPFHFMQHNCLCVYNDTKICILLHKSILNEIRVLLMDNTDSSAGTGCMISHGLASQRNVSFPQFQDEKKQYLKKNCNFSESTPYKFYREDDA